MRRPDGPGEHRALDEGAARARAAYDDLRQRLERLSACHPSSPDYAEPGYSATEYGQTGYAETGYAETGYAETGYAETDYAETDYAGREYGEPGPGERPEPGGDKAPGSGDRASGKRPHRELAEPGEHRPGAGLGGPAGRREPYRPWFTTGESPEPWFTAESGD
jgi:hypothetical protein